MQQVVFGPVLILPVISLCCPWAMGFLSIPEIPSKTDLNQGDIHSGKTFPLKPRRSPFATLARTMVLALVTFMGAYTVYPTIKTKWRLLCSMKLLGEDDGSRTLSRNHGNHSMCQIKNIYSSLCSSKQTVPMNCASGISLIYGMRKLNKKVSTQEQRYFPSFILSGKARFCLCSLPSMNLCVLVMNIPV